MLILGVGALALAAALGSQGNVYPALVREQHLSITAVAQDGDAASSDPVLAILLHRFVC